MDRKTIMILNLAKYGGYLAVFWLSVSSSGFAPAGPLLPLFLVFALDNVRSYYLESKLPSVIVPSLYIQMLLVFTFIYLDGTPVGAILLIILIAESLLSYPPPHGDFIFFISITGFLALSAVNLYGQGTLTWANMASYLINCLFIFFAYGVSYMARRQVIERERAEDALEQLDRSRADLERAYRKLIEVSKEREQLVAGEERSRLARELHDTLAHTLTAIIISLEAGKKLLEKDPRKALVEVSKSQEQARKGLEEVRLTVKALRPGDLGKMDFEAALRGLARDFTGSGIDIHFAIDQNLDLSPSLQTNLYRIVQESITNSVRHGKASLITVRLLKSGPSLSLEIEDDGKGCASLTEGYGLRGIRERADALGGNVWFKNGESGGFIVSMTLGGTT